MPSKWQIRSGNGPNLGYWVHQTTFDELSVLIQAAVLGEKVVKDKKNIGRKKWKNMKIELTSWG